MILVLIFEKAQIRLYHEIREAFIVLVEPIHVLFHRFYDQSRHLWRPPVFGIIFQMARNPEIFLHVKITRHVDHATLFVVITLLNRGQTRLFITPLLIRLDRVSKSPPPTF